MDITPHTNLLKSLRGERIDYGLLIGEGVDNAFDAGARRIAVTVSEDVVSFEDDGCGVTRDKVGALFSLGEHGPMSTTQLGRFGIGLKSQAVNVGDILRVKSKSRDGEFYVDVNWRELISSGSWVIPDPRWKRLVDLNAPTGTTITVADLRKPPAFDHDKIALQLATRFQPAIASGRGIALNGRDIGLLPEPRLTDVIDRQLALSAGRTASVRAGILCAPSTLCRVHIAFQHRVIITNSAFGCESYGGLSKMFARVQLGGPWHLAKFKNDLTDEVERDELEEALFEALKPILEKCNSESMDARIVEISRELNELIPSELAARPKKEKTKSETASSKMGQCDTGNVAAEKSTDGGPARTKRPPTNRLLIVFEDRAQENGVGCFDSTGKIHRVSLSKDHPDIAQLIELRDRPIGRRSLYMIAMMIFEHGRRENAPQLDLPLEKFGIQIANHLAVQTQDAPAGSRSSAS